MANTHQVEIQGKCPFNLSEHDTVKDWLAVMNTPGYGLRIRYSKDAVEWAPNSMGGKTAMYDFTIKGTEAVWVSGLLKLIQALESVGSIIYKARAKDLDNRTKWEVLR